MPAEATYEPIATTTLSTTATEVTFSSLGSYTDIVGVCTLTATAVTSLALRFNGDTGSNYSSVRLQGNGSTAASGIQSSVTRMQIGFPSAGTSTTIPTFCRFNVFSYGGSTNKTVLSEAAGDQNGSGDVSRYVGLWRNTAAITSITITLYGDSFKSGSTFTLYGIKAA